MSEDFELRLPILIKLTELFSELTQYNSDNTADFSSNFGNNNRFAKIIDLIIKSVEAGDSSIQLIKFIFQLLSNITIDYPHIVLNKILIEINNDWDNLLFVIDEMLKLIYDKGFQNQYEAHTDFFKVISYFLKILSQHYAE